jgi:hypothetical protein
MTLSVCAAYGWDHHVQRQVRVRIFCPFAKVDANNRFLLAANAGLISHVC